MPKISKTIAVQLNKPATKGAANRAKTLTPDQFGDLVKSVKRGFHASRDLVAVYLSYYLGLRAQEIAYLEWDRHVFNAKGEFRYGTIFPDQSKAGYTIFISGDIGKRGMERTLPVPAKVIEALRELRAKRPKDIYVFHRLDCGQGHGPLSANAVAQWFKRIYADHGFEGCSSHSGRRTFITQGARKASLAGCSLKDVQLLAGHSDIKTTALYIDPADQVAGLVDTLYDAPIPVAA